MRCEEYESSIVTYTLGELSPKEASECRAHIDGCARCRRMTEEYACLVEGLSRQPEAAPTERESELLSAALDAAAPVRSHNRVPWWSFGAGRAMKLSLASFLLAAVLLCPWMLSSQRPSRPHIAQTTRNVNETQRQEQASKQIQADAVDRRPVEAFAASEEPDPVMRVPVRQRRRNSPRVYFVVRETPKPVAPMVVADNPDPDAEEPRQQTESITPEAAYRAGGMVGRGLVVLSEKARPEVAVELSKKVEGMLVPAILRNRGESDEQINPSDPGDRPNDGVYRPGAMRNHETACAAARYRYSTI